MSTSKKVVVVFGATGGQGESVAKALAKDSQYKVKGVTRNINSDKAKALTQLGIDPVKVDLKDEASIKAALEGAYGVFLVTNFWPDMDAEREVKEGKTTADIAKAVGVKHFVYSGLECVFELMGASDEKHRCPHFDSKGRVTKYIQQQGIVHTIVQYAAYFENLLTTMKPRKDEGGEYFLDVPMGDTPWDMVCVSDAGEVIHQVFNHPDKFSGKVIGLSSDKKTVAEYAEVLNKAFTSEGKKFKASPITTDQFRNLGFPGADDLAAMFDFYISGKCIRDEAKTRELHPGILNFEKWVKQNKDALLKVLD